MAIAVVLWFSSTGCGAELTVLDMAHPEPSSIHATNAQVTAQAEGLVIRGTRGDGVKVLFEVPKQLQDLSARRFLEVEIANTGNRPVAFTLWALSGSGWGGVSTWSSRNCTTPPPPGAPKVLGFEVLNAGKREKFRIDLYARYPGPDATTPAVNPGAIRWIELILRDDKTAPSVVMGNVLATGAGPTEQLGGISKRVAVPEPEHAEPAAGKRVYQQLPGWEKTRVAHVLGLPQDWKPGGRYPVIVEYTGNIFYDKFCHSTGQTDQGNLAWGLSQGKEFICLNLPFLTEDGQGEQINGFGSPEKTVDYCLKAVEFVCAKFGGDRGAIFYTGFSRGSYAANYIALRDDRIADLWIGFVGMDPGGKWNPANGKGWNAVGVGWDERAERLKGRPVKAIAPNYGYGVHVDVEYLEDSPATLATRAWMQEVLARRAKAQRPAPAASTDTSVELKAGNGVTRRFSPTFTVMYATKDPDLTLRWGEFGEPKGRLSYNVMTWAAGPGKAKAKKKAPGHVEDGFNPESDQESGQGRVADYFKVAASVTLTATAAKAVKGGIDWTFAERDDFQLAAHVSLPADGAEPVLTLRFVPKRAGWYSVGYTGSPQADIATADEIWQGLIWQEKRFPTVSFLTEAARCTVPATFVTAQGVTCGVVADPAELPFQPLPTPANSRFGVLVRNAQGKAQPMLFAPILGGAGSKMEAGKPFEFRLRLLARAGGCDEAFRHVARTIYGFRDLRRNVACSLNTVLENEIDYAMGPFARFNDELRGSAYDTDVPGAVKNVSALHPLCVAMVTDNEEIFRKRARPMMEYGLSREKFLFTTNPKVTGQSASTKLAGPGVPLGDLTTLYLVSQKRTPVLLQSAMNLARRTRVLNLDAELRGDTWHNALMLYRATGEKPWLDQAAAGADEYIARRMKKPQADFSDPDSRGMFFWTSFVPNWAELTELYEQTGQRRFLDAAVAGAHAHARMLWMCPAIPDREVTVNEGGLAPAYRKGLPRIRIPEETAPAWRLSEIGLSCESAPTSKGHRAVFLACHAPWMLRLAHYAGDDFLHDIARCAVVGRYTNFPGYHINTARTTVYEKPDFPMRSKDELNSTTSIHYNHIWPHVAMLVDYLVSDAFYRSEGKIDFPSHYAEGYAYVQEKVYGDRPGRVYDREGLWLWMPRGLVSIDNIQLNYIAARGTDALYLVLMNQSPEKQEATVSLNHALAGADAGAALKARTWRQNQPGPSLDEADGKFRVGVEAAGITVLAIGPLHPQAKFQSKLSQPAAALSPRSFTTLDLGETHAMLLSFGPELTSAYVYCQANADRLRRVTLHHRVGNQWKQIADTSYPFEFTVELGPKDHAFTFAIEAEGTDGKITRSEEVTLE